MSSDGFMDLDSFWSIVERGVGAEEPAEVVQAALERLAPAEIVAYQRTFQKLHQQAFRWDLWAVGYIREGGCGDDGFIDFRYGLIAQGRAVFEAALRDPDSLADSNVESDEAFGYAALNAYEAVVGGEMPLEPYDGPTEPAGKQWDFDDDEENARRLPRVAARGGLW